MSYILKMKTSDSFLCFYQTTRHQFQEGSKFQHVRYEVFTAVTMKNGVFWDVAPRDTYNNRCFGGT
jgi:hypothetical protein